MFKNTVLILLTIIMASCGTFRTVPKSNFQIGYGLNKEESKCTSVPRIYSGVAYDFCRLHANKKGTMDNYILLWAYVTDLLVLSPVVDTLLLPITLPQQLIYGSAEVSGKDR